MSSSEADDNPFFLLSDAQQDAILTAIDVASWSSLTLSLCLLATCVVFPTRRKYPQNFTVWSAFCAAILSFAFTLNSVFDRSQLDSRQQTPSFGCYLQALLLQFSAFSLLAWVLLMCLNMYLLIVRAIPAEKIEAKLHLFHGAAWGFGGVMSLAIAGVEIGDSGPCCWVTSNKAQLYLLAPIPIVGLVLGMFLWMSVFRRVYQISLARRRPSIQGYSTVAIEDTPKTERTSLFARTAGAVPSVWQRYLRHLVFLIGFFFIIAILGGLAVYLQFTHINLFPVVMMQCLVLPSTGVLMSPVFLFTRENFLVWKGLLGRKPTVISTNASSTWINDGGYTESA
eukprot:TRINITY_DN6262_c0_g1_i2.p1 TRINITY_DN6262_c0_g1~~TRINITY_DN6262_c0_g1_i2.p1  ORF type:complete len:339 (-),score=67.01 TRINITY_DN6262_c0_g1_i2:36-1052(-)